MIEIVKQMKSWSESTLMFVDPSQKPPLPEISTMLFLLMISQESVGSYSCGRRMRHSQKL